MHWLAKKIAHKITKVSKSSQQNYSESKTEIPEERWQIIDELR